MIDYHDIEFTVDEVEFLTLRYLYQQKLQGRDAVSQAEVMEYLGVRYEPEDEEHMLRINNDGINQLKLMEKHYLN
jgi:hypothetical protein